MGKSQMATIVQNPQPLTQIGWLKQNPQTLSQEYHSQNLDYKNL